MIKLIVSDLDGTLLPYGNSALSAEAKRKIREIIDSGANLAIASGRSLTELTGFLEEFKNDLYFIAADGSYTVRRGKVLYAKPIPREEINFLVKQAAGAPVIFCGAESSYALGAPPSLSVSEKTVFIKNLSSLPVGERIFKILKFGSPVKLPPNSGLRLHWDGRDLGCSEYVSRFANKGAALSDLKIRLSLCESETAVIGDMSNDLPLFKGAKKRIAVGDRCPELRQAADLAVKTGEEALSLICDMLREGR